MVGSALFLTENVYVIRFLSINYIFSKISDNSIWILLSVNQPHLGMVISFKRILFP